MDATYVGAGKYKAAQDEGQEAPELGKGHDGTKAGESPLERLGHLGRLLEVFCDLVHDVSLVGDDARKQEKAERKSLGKI